VVAATGEIAAVSKATAPARPAARRTFMGGV